MEHLPSQLKQRNSPDPRLGIKSSMKIFKPTIASLIIIYRNSSKYDEILFSKEDEGEPKGIRLSDDLCSKIKGEPSYVEKIIKGINSSALFKSQLESLQVAFGTFLHLALIHFDGSSLSERTGSNRYNKRLSFTDKMQTLDLYLSSFTLEEINNFLILWLKDDDENNKISIGIKALLTSFAEDCYYKIRKEEGSDLIFNLESIYTTILKDKYVTFSDKELVGPLRVLNSFIKENMHPYIKFEKGKGIVNSVSEDILANYLNLVSSTLDLIPRELAFSNTNIDTKFYEENKSLQRIYFGAPGGGKSHKVKYEVIGEHNPNSIITTFHPDTDYSSFVGSYKPKKGDDGKITYSFVPEVFAKAYVAAWKLYYSESENKEYYLDIEEINRGNCAQIFGDLFQLLDRKNGFSEYPINVDADFADYIKEQLYGLSDYVELVGQDFSKVLLPPNLHIIATMNTSDQSLFPMDSAFKRRWEWEYVPISFDDTIIKNAQIQIDKAHIYNWQKFVEAINAKILLDLQSSDKQIGQWFVVPQNGLISRDQFISKVMFYLMTDAFKDMEISDQKFYFEELFNDAEDEKLLHFIEVVLEVKNVAITVEPAPTEEESTPEAENA
jgi:hypothetical protein